MRLFPFLDSCVFALTSDRPRAGAGTGAPAWSSSPSRFVHVLQELLKSIHHAKVWRKCRLQAVEAAIVDSTDVTLVAETQTFPICACHSGNGIAQPRTRPRERALVRRRGPPGCAYSSSRNTTHNDTRYRSLRPARERPASASSSTGRTGTSEPARARTTCPQGVSVCVYQCVSMCQCVKTRNNVF